MAAVPDRHVILVSAVPHSGNEDAFRSLLTLVSPEFANLPDVLTGKENELAELRKDYDDGQTGILMPTLGDWPARSATAG